MDNKGYSANFPNPVLGTVKNGVDLYGIKSIAC